MAMKLTISVNVSWYIHIPVNIPTQQIYHNPWHITGLCPLLPTDTDWNVAAV